MGRSSASREPANRESAFTRNARARCQFALTGQEKVQLGDTLIKVGFW